MEPQTQKLLQQAGKFILLGKLTLALEQYLKIYEIEPDDTTIINTIADLYSRLGNKDEAQSWYQNLAETFEYRELFPNAIATYKKLLKISPKNQEAMLRLAQLYERQGQIADATTEYKVIARQLLSLGEYDQAMQTYQKVCSFDPSCYDSCLELTSILEKFGRLEEACQALLLCAEALEKKGNTAAAIPVTVEIIRLKPQNKGFLKSFFALLQKINSVELGVNYLKSLSDVQDADSKAMFGEILLQGGDLQASQQYLLEAVHNNPKLYPEALKLLQELIARKDLEISLDFVEVLMATPIQMHDEVLLRIPLDSLLKMDESNVRTLRIITTLLINLNDHQRLEGYLKRLVILQLKSGNLREGRETLNKLVVYGQNNFYLEVLNLMNKGMLEKPVENVQDTYQQVIQALEQGSWGKEDPVSSEGVPLGVSDLDLGMALGFQVEEELAIESTL